MAEIRLGAVSHRYPGTDADILAGLDLRIGAGEAHALLGGSGAGKTTLVNLLSGLLTPTAGTIEFDGRDVSRVPPRDRRVAQVFQFPVLYPSLTVAEILAFPLRNRGWRRAAARSRAVEIAERLALTPWLGERAVSLSLFQKQLVAIGRALVRPDIALVLLDEPLTAVEPATKWQLRRAIKAIQGELGATMVYVTHDQTEALTFADRISVMHDGRILQTDTPEALYDAPVHEHVAHFVGSPGMNLLEARIADDGLWLGGVRLSAAPPLTPGPCRIGFRPEWAELIAPQAASAEAGSAAVPATVASVRVLGVELHRPVGIVTAQVDGQTLCTRQNVAVQTGDRVVLRLAPQRLLVFRDGRRVAGSSMESAFVGRA